MSFNWTSVHTIVVHGGQAHADDAACVYWAQKRTRGRISVLRVNALSEYMTLENGFLVVDMVGGTFDHHTKSSIRRYSDGTPMASIGLLIEADKEFFSSEKVYEKFVSLLKPIEAHDNGEGYSTINSFIYSLHPNWDEDEAILTARFNLAVRVMGEVLESFIAQAEGLPIVDLTDAFDSIFASLEMLAKIELCADPFDPEGKALKDMVEIYRSGKDDLTSCLSRLALGKGMSATALLKTTVNFRTRKNISFNKAVAIARRLPAKNGVVWLDSFLPTNAFMARTDVSFVGSPGNRGGYQVLSVPKKDGQKLFPEQDRGYTSKVPDHRGMTFCHLKGFLVVFEDQKAAESYMENVLHVG